MLWRDLKAWQIYGANTDVGKTILSTVLCKALQRRAPQKSLLYLKPVSTGPQDEADDRHISRYVDGVLSKCIAQFSDPVSPHLAARQDPRAASIISSDRKIISKVKNILSQHSEAGGRYALVETAGGVLSPAPSMTLQADLYRPLRLPSLLIGDSKLGGIASTISAFESLQIRGYDIDSIILFNDPKWGNSDYLQDHFAKHDVRICPLPMPPNRQPNVKDDEMAMSEYYDKCSSSSVIIDLVDLLHQKHFSRVSKLTSMPSHAESIVWHPFRQHALPQNIIAIDSAYDDHFEVYNQEADPMLASPQTSTSTMTTLASTTTKSLTTPMFDASASWWTQGLGHGNANLALTAAYAAGRYGHVMFANAVHEPALDLAYNLLSTLKNPRLSRVFYTDNGSTGMEVAIKMALRASCQRHGWNKEDRETPVGVLGLKGSYHGDTIGVMNCSESGVFNAKVDWHRPWGHWFDPPQLILRDGKWQLDFPSDMQQTDQTKQFSSFESIFDFSSREADEAIYKDYLVKTLHDLVKVQNHRFGALILEPLIMGAGGMILVDPLFQRTLITTLRENPDLIASSTSTTTSDTDWSGIPVIADEVFTGLYRLGRASSSSFWSSSSTNLDTAVAPDITVHAKLLTGGLIPLAITSASEAIFNTFLSDSKPDALLHGHSYTAHAVGCAVANKSLAEMDKMITNGSWNAFVQDGWSQDLFSFFSAQTLDRISSHERVSGCFAVGTVLAVTLKSDSGAGYTSNAAASIQSRLLNLLDDQGAAVHSRVLGDVIYLMTSLITPKDQVERLERALLRALDMDL